MRTQMNPRTWRLVVLTIIAISLLPLGAFAQDSGEPPPANDSVAETAPAETPAEEIPAEAAAPAPAKPKKTQTQVAEGLENWKAGIDLSPYAPGKYNLVVTGTDAAGNLTEVPPFNVYVDPESDLPVVTIVNPYSLMRVGGDLNVAGTCKDDDGVAKVEVSLDGGEFLPADGSDFWSLYIKTQDIPDGRKILDVRGVDVNGVTGRPVRVAFDLDRAKPNVEVLSPSSSVPVAGPIKFEGTAFDLNGIASLEISLDGGATYAEVKLPKSKDMTRPGFSYPVDTRKLPDGPNVVWFRCVDGVGSQDRNAFLVFVDNTKPAIEIVRPAEGVAVNGRFTVAGAVRDTVGVKSFSYVFAGGAPVDIPLTRGDPYFSVEFDAGLIQKGDKVDLVLVAEDNIGNVTRYNVNPRIDRKADMPVLSLTAPAAGGVLRTGELVWGSIADDDGVSALRWSLDGAAPVEVPCSESFGFALPAETASGKHKLALMPVDSNGLAGLPVALEFSLDRGPGSVVFERLVAAKGERPFSAGIEAKVDGGEALEGAALSANALTSLSWSFNGGPPASLPVKAEGGKYRFRIPIDRNLPYGFVALTVSAADAFGNAIEGRTLIYLTNYGVIREQTGFRFADPRVGAAAEGSDEATRVAFGPPAESGGAGPILGAFYREELESLRLEPATDRVSATFEGMTVTLAAGTEGITEPTRLIGRTTKGHEFSAGPYVFVTDFAGPELSLELSPDGTWFRGRAEIKGRASDSGGLASVAYRVIAPGAAAGEFTALESRADGSFSFSLEAATLASGPFTLEVEAKDASGNSSRAHLNMGADAQAPALSFLGPEPGAEVWGPEDVVALIADVSGTVSVEYAEDGSSFAPIEHAGSYFIHRADLAANPKAAYRVIDRAGNEAVARPEVSVVAAPVLLPRAEALAVEPEPGAEDRAAEARIELAGTSGARKVSLVLPAMGDASFTELGMFDGKEPPERFATRLLVSGALALKGQAVAATPFDGSAPQPLKSVEVSFNGGSTYALLASYKELKAAKTALPFALNVPVTALKSGELRWVIKVTDFAGAYLLCPVYALVDTTAPAVTLLYPPAAAAAQPGPFPFLFKVEDSGPVGSVDLVNGAVKEPVDISSGGRYFARSFDPSATPKLAPIALAVQARDAAGNLAQAAAKFTYDAARDAPAVSVAELPSIMRAGDIVYGGAADDDGVPSIEVSVDGGSPAAFAAGAFALALPELSGGAHTLSVAATDAKGRRSEVKKTFRIVAAAPSFGPIELGDAKARSPWSPGAAFALGPGSLVAGSVTAPNGLASIEMKVNGGAPIKTALGKVPAPGAPIPFTAALPAGLPYDRITLAFKAVDAAGLAAEAGYELHGILPSSREADDADALRLNDERILSADEGYGFLLAPGEELRGRFNGRPIASVAVQPATESLEASFDGPIVALKAAAEGLPGLSRLVLRTVDGDEFAWGPFAARVDAAAPALEVAAPLDHEWKRGELAAAGKASDPTGLSILDVAINGGEPRPLTAQSGGAAASLGKELDFDSALALAAAADGTVRLDFRARDGAGRESRVTRFINKDTLAPAISQVMPATGYKINGTTTVVFEAIDSGRLESASFQVAAGGEGQEVAGLGTVSKTLDFARLEMPMAEGGGFRFVDRAGNSAVLAPDLVVDKETDKPVAEIHAPLDNEVLRGDFAISGVAYDDDGLAAALYRIDSGEWVTLAMDGTSFSVPIALKDTTDNEHLVEVRTEDIYGVQGDIVSRKYRISKEEPEARMTEPPLFKACHGTIDLAGTSSDENGIAELVVSVDNRVSYNKPTGTEQWRYTLDTQTISDGLHAIAVRPIDGYGTEGFYASLIYVDNTAPKAAIDLPADGGTYRGTMQVSGRVTDNLALVSSRIEIAPVGKGSPALITIDLGTANIVRRSIDVTTLPPGAYAVRLIARDRSEKETLASRNVVIEAGAAASRVEILYPLEGSTLAGRLTVYGRALVAGGTDRVVLRSGDQELGSAAPDGHGYFVIEADTKTVEDGELKLVASALPLGAAEAAAKAADDAAAKGASPAQAEEAAAKALREATVLSRADLVLWKRLGPWVSIDSFAAGRYIPYRPFLEGSAGWATDFPDPEDKAAVDAFRKSQKQREPVSVEVSIDNGRSFFPADGAGKWKFRLETTIYPEGGLYIITRAHFKDGSTALAKTLFFIDKTSPKVEVDAPAEDGRFNGLLTVSGTASDENGLEGVSVALRKGDKKSYAMPAFIQGLYLDAHVLGSTTWEAGLGLTFFDDNVKLQGLFGSAPEFDAQGNTQRFYGNVIGAKLIANLGLLPFNALFGPDWDFLSASFGVGANFSYFTETQSGNGLIVTSVVGQLEFPKITIKDWKMFKTFSFYTELQVWVVSSDVQGGFIPKMSFGLRTGLF